MQELPFLLTDPTTWEALPISCPGRTSRPVSAPHHCKTVPEASWRPSSTIPCLLLRWAPGACTAPTASPALSSHLSQAVTSTVLSAYTLYPFPLQYLASCLPVSLECYGLYTSPHASASSPHKPRPLLALTLPSGLLSEEALPGLKCYHYSPTPKPSCLGKGL